MMEDKRAGTKVEAGVGKGKEANLLIHFSPFLLPLTNAS